MGDQHKTVSCGECGKQYPAWQMDTASAGNGLVYYLCKEHSKTQHAKNKCIKSPDGNHNFQAGESLVICIYCGVSR